jgi:hypothetical protein
MCGCVYVRVLYVWVCVRVGFVMCVCFGNTYICIYCVFYGLCLWFLGK